MSDLTADLRETRDKAATRVQHRNPAMETIEIGAVGPPVSRIALGTWAIGGWMWGGSDIRDAFRTIQAATDQGINLIDTAPVYGFGLAEEIVGRALRPNGRRRRIHLATKCGLEWHGSKVRRNASPERIREEVEDSLRRLRTDYIDVYQLHWPDPAVPLEETAAVFAKLLQEGKIRAVGVSNLDRERTHRFRQMVPLSTVQPPYNLFERGIDAELLPYARETGLVVLAYSALCRGLLSGRMNSSTQFAGDDLRRVDPKFQQPRFNQYLAAVSALDRFARMNFGKSVLALALRWILDRRALGRAQAGTARSDGGCDGLEARCREHAGNRPHPRRHDHEPGWPRIHAPPEQAPERRVA